MSKSFKPGLIYVFSMKKYIKDRGRKMYWARLANGRKVNLESKKTENGFAVVPVWCKCIGLERRNKA